MGRELDIRTEPGGERLYVEGLPLHAGDGVEILDREAAHPEWWPGRYEYQIRDGRLTALYVYLDERCVILLPDSTRYLLRLPRQRDTAPGVEAARRAGEVERG